MKAPPAGGIGPGENAEGGSRRRHDQEITLLSARPELK